VSEVATDEKQGVYVEEAKPEPETLAPPPPAPELKEEKAKEEPPAAAESNIYDFHITKGENGALGMKLDMWKTGIYVSSLTPGALVDKHNVKLEDASKRVQVSDFIVSVKSGEAVETVPAKMVELLKRATGTVEMKMYRPEPVTVTIPKSNGKTLGLNVSIQEEKVSKTIFVSGIQDGAVKEYNADAKGPMVQANDVIIKVNEVSESAAAMLDEMKKVADSVTLVVVRSPA